MASSESVVGVEETKTKTQHIEKRKFYDRIAKYIVVSGGIAVILSILAILFFIGAEVVPLWLQPKYELVNEFDLSKSFNLSDKSESYKKSIVLVGTEEYKEIAFLVSNDGSLKFVNLKDGSELETLKLSVITEDNFITSSSVSIENKSFVVGTSDGYIQSFTVNYNIEFDQEGKRSIISKLLQSEPIKVADNKIVNVNFQENDDGVVATAVYTEKGEFLYYYVFEEEDFLGDVERQEINLDLTGSFNEEVVTDVQIDQSVENLYVSTNTGKLYHWKISDNSPPSLAGVFNVSEGNKPLTALGFLLGDRSIIVGDMDGNISVWFETADEENKVKLRRVHNFPPLESAITEFSYSPRDRGFIASDITGNVGIYNASTANKQLEFKGEGYGYNSITYSPKTDGLITVDDRGVLRDWYIDNPHPETTLKSVFGKIWYEGYQKPEYVWQSTGGTDEFEPKFSLTPLAYGTIKGAIYAMLFALPLAVLGAIAVSQFMHPSIRNVIKPILEIMAALPSVVLGFFAGLWLAPVVEKIFPALVIMPVLITFFAILSVYLWSKIPLTVTGKLRVGSELFFLVPVIMLGILVSLGLNGPLESLLFNGDYKAWFYDVLGLQYDQRNALIVGFAMGFAVIPIIFTISEDALSSIPRNLTSGSLALGANRWQTAIKIVLPSASPGIFSAIMIGFGRAVGETMIVLMATGNTPLMDWSFFNGFRALSANIAVELPEAPHGGTLYRILFLSALLLFFLTFILNTIAEIIRHRLRKKYGEL